jgi:hypothetical protein
MLDSIDLGKTNGVLKKYPYFFGSLIFLKKTTILRFVK